MSNICPEGYRIAHVSNIQSGLEQIHQAGLFWPHSHLSKVQRFFHDPASWSPARPTQTQHDYVTKIWLAFKGKNRTPVGMALISIEPGAHEENRPTPTRVPVLSLFVSREHAGHGLGLALARTALKAYPERLTAHYTRDSIALCQSLGIADIDQVRAQSDEKGLAFVLRTHTALHHSRWPNNHKEQPLPGHARPHHGGARFTTPPPGRPAPVERLYYQARLG